MAYTIDLTQTSCSKCNASLWYVPRVGDDPIICAGCQIKGSLLEGNGCSQPCLLEPSSSSPSAQPIETSLQVMVEASSLPAYSSALPYGQPSGRSTGDKDAQT